MCIIITSTEKKYLIHLKSNDDAVISTPRGQTTVDDSNVKKSFALNRKVLEGRASILHFVAAGADHLLLAV